jgi:hypothetical protein
MRLSERSASVPRMKVLLVVLLLLGICIALAGVKSASDSSLKHGWSDSETKRKETEKRHAEGQKNSMGVAGFGAAMAVLSLAALIWG